MEQTYYVISIKKVKQFDRPQRKAPPNKNEGAFRLFVFFLATFISLCLITAGFSLSKTAASAQNMQKHVIDTVASVSPEAAIYPQEAASINYPPVERTATNYGDTYDIPSAATSQKTYMDYRAITSTTSDQWAMQQTAWTDTYGFRRDGNTGYYMVAMGTYYSQQCGKMFEITFDGYNSIRVIVGDIKDDAHTDDLNQHRNGNVVEFIVDTTAIEDDCRVMGDMSWTTATDMRGVPISITEIYREG